MDQQNIDLSTITDVNTLKIIKSDQYDLLEMHNNGANSARVNIEKLNARIHEIQVGTADPKAAERPQHARHSAAAADAANGSSSEPTGSEDATSETATTTTTTEAV